jgi:leucyl-tRNA synthetase
MNLSVNWDLEISTCHPGYYKHSQRLFLSLLADGLVVRKKALVNWDPIDETVLANEQVDSNGRADRSGAVVEQRMLKQWFFEITKYAEVSGLHKLIWSHCWKTLIH